MNRLTYILIIILIFGCQSESENNDHWGGLSPDLISAVDISDYPKILSYSPTFYDENNNEINFINALIQNGVNTIRLRLWVNPADESSSLEEVKEFSNELRSMGFKIWITPHFSDTWAHPGQQQIPSNWESLSFEELKNQLYAHTNQIMSEINPDYIQIGNEINTGILFPHGNIMENQDQFIELVNIGVDAESATLDQVVKQLDKLINVVRIQELSPSHSVSRELILATVNLAEGNEDNIMREVESFDANVLSVGEKKIMVSLSGPPEVIDEFEAVLEKYGIVEVQRTGIVALATIAD